MNAPQRAVVLIAKVEADSRADMANALYTLAGEVERGYINPTSTSGGYSSGWIVNLTENHEQTHDAYFKELNAYLEAKRTTTQGQNDG